MALVNQPAILPGAFAAEGDKNTIPANNDGLSGLASIAKGFPQITQVPLAQGGQPPQRQDFNGIFNLFSQFLLYAQNGGVYAYNNTLDYQPPCIISYDGEFYSCVAENGPSTSAGVQPVTNTDYWEKLVPDVAVMKGATSGAAGASGLVPAPAQNQQNYFLTGGGIWRAVATTQQAKEGTDDTAPMTALKVKQAITAQVQGIPIGDVVYRPYLADGYVKANGATVNRSDYPNLVTFANEKSLWTSNPSGEPWKYGVGDGSTTMVLPDFRSRFIMGGDSVSTIAPGLPNITGNGPRVDGFYATTGANGAFYTYQASGNKRDTSHSSSNEPVYCIDASHCSSVYGASDTVQPPAFALIPQIKY